MPWKPSNKAYSAYEELAKKGQVAPLIDPLDCRTGDPPVIELNALTLRIRGTSAPGVAESVSHRFEPGRIHAVVGSSGSGKSTLVNAMLGLHPLDAGENPHSRMATSEWTLVNEDLLKRESWLDRVGLSQPAAVLLWWFSVGDNLDYSAHQAVRVDVETSLWS